MGLMIKEKVRIAWERDLQITVCYGVDSEMLGYVDEWHVHAVRIRDTKVFDPMAEKGRAFYFKDITDICFVDEGEEATTRTRTVCKETLDFLRGQVDWNADGEHIKTEYVHNLIDDLEKAMESNKSRMNWPFLEECVQDGANREMDEEDKPGLPEPERWEVIHSEGHYRLESTHGKRIALSDCIPLETAIAMAGAVQMRDALRMVTRGPRFNRIHRGTVVSDITGVEFNPDQWRIITDALEKAGGSYPQEGE